MQLNKVHHDKLNRQILLKTPTMQLNKVHHDKLNRQNRNKMGEDRQRRRIINNLTIELNNQ